MLGCNGGASPGSRTAGVRLLLNTGNRTAPRFEVDGLGAGADDPFDGLPSEGAFGDCACCYLTSRDKPDILFGAKDARLNN